MAIRKDIKASPKAIRIATMPAENEVIRKNRRIKDSALIRRCGCSCCRDHKLWLDLLPLIFGRIKDLKIGKKEKKV
jgi:hypothetical protein